MPRVADWFVFIPASEALFSGHFVQSLHKMKAGFWDTVFRADGQDPIQSAERQGIL
jgi:hypothetical protein